MVPLGPFNDVDGRWCCGLLCARPCPYGLKLKPGWKTPGLEPEEGP
jgi:hypothetical protein